MGDRTKEEAIATKEAVAKKNNWIIEIKTGADFFAAVQRHDELLDSKPGTIEDSEFEWLENLIMDYEEKHFA
jgi:antitoxin component HigA of HigAB toxin-antitoxin module